MPLLKDPKAHWMPRELFSIRGTKVSVRNQKFRLDSEGRLFDIGSDRGQRKDVSAKHPDVTLEMRQRAQQYREEMESEFAKNHERPFNVGVRASTMLPARDGQEHGDVQRSVKSPNNSFFTNWKSKNASITWDVDVATAGDYEVIVRYTCAVGDEGVTMRLTSELQGESVQFTSAPVVEVFDPPLYDKSKERVEKSHYFVKDFKTLLLGNLHLPEGECKLRLSADEIIGTKAIDVHSIQLVRKSIE
jgi:hypothetical protein